ncbi:hypothetical protein MKK88_28500 [Methylobacterium sp. E-005]|uniref:hypothetical protein n=1 Tax=Methylobacterium sp. E-005 TaxID=2836549 RepID=UPI001FBB2AAA|nr:hypothetical protein [Methylobacterium sp. E-005]MCJ2089899.1 hypothetical protein [Methylobacterium sp. E-005]
MGMVHLDLDDTLDIGTIDLDVATGIAKIGDETFRILHVLAANEFTIPLTFDTAAEEALRLADAVIDWDCGMMEHADNPFRVKAPKLSAKQVIRLFLPRMHKCEFRDLFIETYGYAGRLP